MGVVHCTLSVSMVQYPILIGSAGFQVTGPLHWIFCASMPRSVKHTKNISPTSCYSCWIVLMCWLSPLHLKICAGNTCNPCSSSKLYCIKNKNHLVLPIIDQVHIFSIKQICWQLVVMKMKKRYKKFMIAMSSIMILMMKKLTLNVVICLYLLSY